MGKLRVQLGRAEGRISRIYRCLNKQNPLETVGADDICAVVGFKDVRTGDTLCDERLR